MAKGGSDISDDCHGIDLDIWSFGSGKRRASTFSLSLYVYDSFSRSAYISRTCCFYKSCSLSTEKIDTIEIAEICKAETSGMHCDLLQFMTV